MLVRDLNGDGRNDVIVGMGHAFGLYWHEQLAPDPDGKLTFRQHTIDESFSQPHALHFVDLDGDGADELITGKRVFAHNGGDPGGKEQPCNYYYEWDAKTLKFTRHTIEEGRVGIGLQIRTADLNGDGRLDIAVAGKSGTYTCYSTTATEWIEEGLCELDAPIAFGPHRLREERTCHRQQGGDGHALVVSAGRNVRKSEPVKGSLPMANAPSTRPRAAK